MIVTLFQNALDYIASNHILAVYLLCICISFFVVLAVKDKTIEGGVYADLNKGKALFFYGAVMYALLFFPISAAVLSKFQSVFFSYNYLWIALPVVPTVAIALTAFSGSLKSLKKSTAIITVVMVLVLLLLCGNMGVNTKKDVATNEWKEAELSFEEVKPIIDKMQEIADSDPDALFLAPPSVTKYAHWYSGNIRTLYGRDMWEASLGAYHYDEYSDEVKDLYTWIEFIDAYGIFYYCDGPEFYDCFDLKNLDYDYMDSSEKYYGGIKFALMAKEQGVTAICFPINEATDRAALERIEKALSVSGESIEIESSVDDGYYTLYLN